MPTIDSEAPPALLRPGSTSNQGFKTNAINPRLSIDIMAYSPLPSTPITNTAYWLNEREKKAVKAPIAFPMNLVEQIDIDDGDEGGSFTISIPGGNRHLFDSAILTGLRLSEIVDEGTILVFKEGGIPIFCGYVLSVGDSGAVDASDMLQITGGGMEAMLEKQTLFIDANFLTPPTGIPSTVAQAPTKRFFAAITAFLKALKTPELSPELLVKQFADSAYTLLFSNGTYGGLPISTFIDTTLGISNDIYSRFFTHVVNMVNQAQFGNTLNYWKIMQTFVKKPLYDLFFHYNLHDNLYLDPTRSLAGLNIPTGAAAANRATSTLQADSLAFKGPVAYLVFRKTPWIHLLPNGTQLPPLHQVISSIRPSKLSGFHLKSNLDDIISGFHVAPAIFDNMSSLIINKVLYSPAVLNKFGQRVMSVQLDGVKFVSTSGTETVSLMPQLIGIQNLLNIVFGNGDRVISGTITGHYDRRVSKGKILQIQRPLPKGLARYDNEFYISGRSVSFNPSQGSATMTLNVKWGRRASRMPIPAELLDATGSIAAQA